jgi:hypothetical protein
VRSNAHAKRSQTCRLIVMSTGSEGFGTASPTSFNCIRTMRAPAHRVAVLMRSMERNQLRVFMGSEPVRSCGAPVPTTE